MPESAPPAHRDPAVMREAHALRAAFEPFTTLAQLHGSAVWPALAPRLEALLTRVRLHPAHERGALTNAPDLSSPAARTHAGDGARVRLVQWNIEHGNAFAAIADALAQHPQLAGADLVTLNEADLGMARSGNRDVAAELVARSGLHAAWAALFLESTRGRDDDARSAVAGDNEESLFGLAILSRWPITASRLVPLPGPERELFERERMAGRFAALVCEIAHPLRPFVAVTVHLEVHRTRAHRAVQMRQLLAALAHETRPVVLAGDWNTHTFDRGERHAVFRAAWPLLTWPSTALAERLTRPDRGACREGVFDELRAAGFAWEPYVDAAPTLGMRFSRLGEVHAMPGPLRALASHGLEWVERRAQLRLDWIAARGFAHHRGRGCTVRGLDGPGLASDHAPITAELAFE